MKHKFFYIAAAKTVSVFLVSASIIFAGQAGAAGIVASIEKAPVIADGDVSGKPFDYVITLDGSLDSYVAGRGLANGAMIKVIFPSEFDLSNIDPAFPLSDVPKPPPLPCGPGTNPPNPDNPIYQTTTVGSEAPFVWSFLLWGKGKEPLDDVSLNWPNPNHAQLMRRKKVVGHIFIDTPQGAVGHGIEVAPVGGCPTWLPGAPVIAGTPGIGPQPVGRLDLLFWTGNVAGDYTTTISLNNGNSVQMVVTAE